MWISPTASKLRAPQPPCGKSKCACPGQVSEITIPIPSEGYNDSDAGGMKFAVFPLVAPESVGGRGRVGRIKQELHRQTFDSNSPAM